ncbi:MAG: hypothetical protein JW741_27850 [Sedimentisphaerales bacterium]|nr:hypothetical protein [Sedimentisphaerales bacterium]
MAFPLQEIPVFDVPVTVHREFIFGAYADCQTEPAEAVKQYPAFKSDKPLYGSFQVGGERTEPEAGYHYAFALDESKGAGLGYDRMYIDLNLNGDLTDDSCCLPMKDVPDKALIKSSSFVAEVCFDPVMLRVTPADDPQHRLAVMPRFFAYKSERRYATLMSTKVRTGTIRIGWKKLDVVLGHGRAIPGWFDHPATDLYLMPANQPHDSPVVNWYGGSQLKALHRTLGTYYRLSATPSGDRLFVWPYQGPFGVLEIKAGQRNVRKVSATGTLVSKDMAISLTEGLGGRNAPTSNSYRIPVGDYCPLLLNVTYGTLNSLMLRNRHADGRPGGRAQEGAPVYAIRIRADRPFVLDFSGEPQVVFASPSKDHRVQRGEQLEVKAVLIDPALDIMFRMVNKGGQLKPTVVIKRANGEIVAEGTMPFG